MDRKNLLIMLADPEQIRLADPEQIRLADPEQIRLENPEIQCYPEIQYYALLRTRDIYWDMTANFK